MLYMIRHGILLHLLADHVQHLLRHLFLCCRQGSFRAGTHRNAVPVLFLITGTTFRSFSAYSCKI